MNVHTTKSKEFSGTQYKRVWKQAWGYYRIIKKKSKRRPYIKSEYFDKRKIFLTIFWSHIKEKRVGDRMRRLKFYACAVEVLKSSKVKPRKMFNKEDGSYLYRFYGKTYTGKSFAVQVKENRNKQLYLISVFPQK